MNVGKCLNEHKRNKLNLDGQLIIIIIKRLKGITNSYKLLLKFTMIGYYKKK